LIETEDFCTFRIGTLGGAAALNKGMALFPRRVGGRYAMLGRGDRESIFFMTSDDPVIWRTCEPLRPPTYSWELVQIGNCGSPIETEHGWIVITHGVGPMRRYVLGALLLDLDNPARVIGALREPLMAPDEHEREGYVPNVLYSCGAMQHGPWLVLPHGFSDSGVGVALVRIDELVAAMMQTPG